MSTELAPRVLAGLAVVVAAGSLAIGWFIAVAVLAASLLALRAVVRGAKPDALVLGLAALPPALFIAFGPWPPVALAAGLLSVASALLLPGNPDAPRLAPVGVATVGLVLGVAWAVEYVVVGGFSEAAGRWALAMVMVGVAWEVVRRGARVPAVAFALLALVAAKALNQTGFLLELVPPAYVLVGALLLPRARPQGARRAVLA